MKDQIKEDYIQLKQRETDLCEIFEKFEKTTGYSVSKKDKEEAVKRVKSAVNVVTKTNNHSNKLCEKDMIEIHNIIDGLRSEPNRKALFTQIEGNQGIEESFSGKKFYFV